MIKPQVISNTAQARSARSAQIARGLTVPFARYGVSRVQC